MPPDSIKHLYSVIGGHTKRLKGKKIIVCASDKNIIEERIKKRIYSGENLEWIILNRDSFPPKPETVELHKNIIQRFRNGNCRTLFILGCPFWDEIKELEGTADTSIWINRGPNPDIEFVYYTIACASETRCYTSNSLL